MKKLTNGYWIGVWIWASYARRRAICFSADRLFHCRLIVTVQYGLFIAKIGRRPRQKNSTETILRNLKIGLLDESRVSDALLAFTRKLGFEVNVCLRATSYIQLVQAVRASYCA